MILEKHGVYVNRKNLFPNFRPSEKFSPHLMLCVQKQFLTNTFLRSNWDSPVVQGSTSVKRNKSNSNERVFDNFRQINVFLETFSSRFQQICIFDTGIKTLVDKNPPNFPMLEDAGSERRFWAKPEFD